jgi:CSLREA domain-containing protein
MKKKRQNDSSGAWALRITFFLALASISAILLASSFKAAPAPGNVGGPSISFATLFVVTTTDDHNDFSCDSDCTLREAIQAANNTVGDSVINFNIPTTDPGYSNGVWTITLASALPPLSTSSGSSNLSINGPGADKLTVQRNPTYGPPVSAPLLQFRIFNVTTSGTASISGMTITNGSVFSQTDYLGGGIQNYNAGTVSLTNCVLKNNQAERWTDFRGNFGPYALGGGIANRAGGTINITSSTLDSNYGDYGGAVYNSGNGTVNVSNSTIGSDLFANSAVYGGGIYNDNKTNLTNTTLDSNEAEFGGGVYNDSGTVVITGCTLSNNVSYHSGGGVPNVGVGGGIYNVNAAIVNVINSTLYNNGNDQGNTNNGGGIYNAGTLNVTNSTLALNYISGAGGGIFNDSAGTATIKSTIIAGNYVVLGSSGSLVGGPDLYGSFTSGGYNLVFDTRGNTGFNQPTDLTLAEPSFESDTATDPFLKTTAAQRTRLH